MGYKPIFIHALFPLDFQGVPIGMKAARTGDKLITLEHLRVLERDLRWIAGTMELMNLDVSIHPYGAENENPNDVRTMLTRMRMSIEYVLVNRTEMNFHCYIIAFAGLSEWEKTMPISFPMAENIEIALEGMFDMSC